MFTINNILEEYNLTYNELCELLDNIESLTGESTMSIVCALDNIYNGEEEQKMEYINKEALEIIEQKLKQGKRIEMEYNHQKDELKILEHKITRIKLDNK